MTAEEVKKVLNIFDELVDQNYGYEDNIGQVVQNNRIYEETAKRYNELQPKQEQSVSEEFDGEFSKFSNDVDAEHPFPICVDEFKDFARHFYELGKQSECVKVKAESSIDRFILENCTHCTIEHCLGMRECYTSSNKQLQ